VLDSDVAGEVEAVGERVTRFRPGDEVFAHVLSGAFAERAAVPEGLLGHKPAKLTFEQAAAVPGKWLGAEVTGVCSTTKVDLVRSLGADHVVDHTREDFAVRPPAAGLLRGQAERGRPAGPGRADRGRPGLAGDRPDLPLPETPAAIRYLEQDHARGKVVITAP
jgi:hypothetical protein